jgi:hypothetical protein
MKTRVILLILIVCSSIQTMHAQLEGIIVEEYYISGTTDTLDPISQDKLALGSATYRIYADLEPGIIIKSLFADSAHPFIITSTEAFFNHSLHDKSYAYTAPGDWLNLFNSSTLALDSWLTIGFATAKHFGVPKTMDPDSSILATGVCLNEDPLIEISPRDKDGLIETDSTIDSYSIRENASLGTTIFSPNAATNSFISYVPIIISDKGYTSSDTNNIILLAQLTTAGDLSFNINLELFDPNEGANGKNYHFTGIDTLKGLYCMNGNAIDYSTKTCPPEKQTTVRYSNKLKYPFKRGCTDPYVDCYDPEAVIDDSSCVQCDPMVLGCLDVNACNYNSEIERGANYHLPELCCYGPDNCGGRDIELVCPSYGKQVGSIDYIFYPNPGTSTLNVDMYAREVADAKLEIYTLQGLLVFEKDYTAVMHNYIDPLDISNLSNGAYVIKFSSGNESVINQFIKQ